MIKKGFVPVILTAVLALVIAVGGVGIGLAWKTNRLDKWLPPNIKEMFGRGEKPEKEPEEEPEEDLTKDWKTYESEFYGISFKYPETYQITEQSAEGIRIGAIRLILSDQTRPGSLRIDVLLNPGGVGGACWSDISYQIATKEGKVEVLSRHTSDRAENSYCREVLGDIDRWIIFFGDTFEKSSGPICPFGESKSYCLQVMVFFEFLRDGPDYEPELRQIIETIRVTN